MGVRYVWGRSRVPLPAKGITAFMVGALYRLLVLGVVCAFGPGVPQEFMKDALGKAAWRDRAGRAGV